MSIHLSGWGLVSLGLRSLSLEGLLFITIRMVPYSKQSRKTGPARLYKPERLGRGPLSPWWCGAAMKDTQRPSRRLNGRPGTPHKDFLKEIIYLIIRIPLLNNVAPLPVQKRARGEAGGKGYTN